jgi:hypothetical protein
VTAEARHSIVEREEVHVMFLRTADTQSAIERGWRRLESMVALRGRKFYGAFHPMPAEYWVCAELHDGDDPPASGLEVGVLPGGRYLRARIQGEPPGVYRRIKPTFDALMRAAEPDGSRPSLEFYRRRDEVECLLPVR